MLLHMPLYCVPSATDDTTHYMVELLLASLDSYYVHGNTEDVLVTTNDRRVEDIVLLYKKSARRPFELLRVTTNDLLEAFCADESRLSDEPCLKMLFSKFFPILKRLDDQIVHVDFDTMFTSKIDFSPLFASDIGLVDANQLGRRRRWHPSSQMIKFFRMDPSRSRPLSSWINTGVFSVQGRGFELCRDEIDWYLANLDWANAAKINVYPDEIIMNALAIREPGSVTALKDYSYNFLAYYLSQDAQWLERSAIVHFHMVKPHRFRHENGSVIHDCRRLEERYITDDLYLAVLRWCIHLHAACLNVGVNLNMLRAMPSDIVLREHQRVLARLTSKAGGADKLSAHDATQPNEARHRIGRKPSPAAVSSVQQHSVDLEAQDQASRASYHLCIGPGPIEESQDHTRVSPGSTSKMPADSLPAPVEHVTCESSIKFFAWSSRRGPELEPLLHSAGDCGVPLEIIGPEMDIDRYPTDTMFKIEVLIEHARALPAETIVLCTDSYDVLYVQGPAAIKTKFLGLGSNLVFSAERWYSSQLFSCLRHYQGLAPVSPYRYLNAGCIMGRAEAICDMMDVIRSYDLAALQLQMRRVKLSDQSLFGKYASENANRCLLDRSCELFWCTAGEWEDVPHNLAFRDGLLVNRITGTSPAIVHVPYLSKYQHVFDFLARRVKSSRRSEELRSSRS